MSSSDSIPAKPSEDWPPRILAFLVIAAGIGLVVLLYFGPAGNTSLPPVRADILKSIASAILQLIVLGVVGVAVKAEFDRHQQRVRKLEKMPRVRSKSSMRRLSFAKRCCGAS